MHVPFAWRDWEMTRFPKSKVSLKGHGRNEEVLPESVNVAAYDTKPLAPSAPEARWSAASGKTDRAGNAWKTGWWASFR
jgi:hypothetical protein